MRSRITTVIAAVAAVSLLLVGCADISDEAGSDPNNPNQVEVITWWTSGTEKTAFYAMVGVFAKDNPDLELVDASVAGGAGANAREAIAARLESNNPPDTFQSAAGAGLSDYVANGDLQDLTSFYEENDLVHSYRAALLDLLSVNGKIYSVPTGIHRVNVLWSNDLLLRKAGVDPEVVPANIDDWLANLEKVRQSGIEYPLALGNDWTQVQLFENVLLADLGAVLYQNLWKSTKNWDGEAVREAIEHYKQLLEYTKPTRGSIDWVEANKSVIEGEAAYILMADFAQPAFQRVGGVQGGQFSAIPTPGTVGFFDFFADSFTLPVGAVHEKAAKAWLLTVASAEGQKELSLVKGSIPARTDTIADDFFPYQRDAIDDLQLGTIVPSLAHGVAASPAWTQQITTAVVEFGSDGRSEAFLNALIDAAEQNAAE